MQLTGTDLDNVVDEALTLFRRDLDSHHVELQRERGKAVRVAADPDRLCQVFANIVRNAIEAMPEGGTLSVATSVEADRARVTFTDTGTGIVAQDLPRVFRPCFTTKRSGLGIGLALSLRTIAAHGGTLEASSQAGRGATFTVALPTEASHG
jgi:two-component system sensor histidine kinase HydH